ATDSMAAGARRYLREHGVEVPEQILVAGQGDSELARVTMPPFITVHYSYEKSGEIAVKMLMEQMGNGESTMREVKLGCSIVNPTA
ncbi:MAG: substrate-binding domain-containing protein, partial [Acetatifactor sp.]|nr:substrate-binding domain-containing protein [Acetatifactor sp.]